jgi:membrane protease YdiL (CAAX protease family)
MSEIEWRVVPPAPPSVPPPPPLPPPPPMRTLGVWATFGWTLLAFALAQTIGTAIVFIWFPDHLPSTTSLRYGGTLVALVTLATNPVLVALLAGIARWRTGASATAYLGLTRFTWRDFLVGFAAIAAFAGASDLFNSLVGIDIVPPFQTEVFTSVGTTGWLIALALAIVVVGPIGEEVMFRGFLFRGWVAPGWRGVVAIAVISLLWSMLHVQYAFVQIAQIFLIGLILGWIRWRSASTALTMVLHILVNLESTIETFVKIGWPLT